MVDPARQLLLGVGAMLRENEELQLRVKALENACERLGPWMAAALDDPNVCEEMKADIKGWFSILGGEENGKHEGDTVAGEPGFGAGPDHEASEGG